MGCIELRPGTVTELVRPHLLVEAAQYGARIYRRQRDLPGAVAGLLARPEHQILRRLFEAEHNHEEMRRQKSAAYRSAKHIQTLAALFAEARAAKAETAQPIASGSDCLRLSI